MSNYALSSRFIVRHEDFGALMFDRRSWNLYHTNQTGDSILELLSKRSISSSSVCDYFAQTYGTLSDTQISSINAFINHLLQLNVIEETSQDRSRVDGTNLATHGQQSALIESHHFARYLSAPIFVWWDITALCNLKCKQCYSSSGKPLPDELSLPEVCAVLDQLAQMKVFYVYFLGGEPFLRKDFLTILEYCRSIGLEVMINTNGWYITDQVARELAMLDVRRVRVSIDGASSQTHDAIRGVRGSFDRAINAVNRLKSAGVTVVGITPTMMHENVQEARMLIDLAYELNVDEIQLVQVCAVGRGRGVAPLDINDIDDLRNVIATKSSKIGKRILITGSEGVWERPFSDCVMSGRVFPEIMGCGAGRTCLAISPNGKVRACLLYQRIVGDLRDQDFRHIWEAKDNHNLRRLRQVKDSCDDCSYASVCSGPCPMQELISPEQRECFVKRNAEAEIGKGGKNTCND